MQVQQKCGLKKTAFSCLQQACHLTTEKVTLSEGTILHIVHPNDVAALLLMIM